MHIFWQVECLTNVTTVVYERWEKSSLFKLPSVYHWVKGGSSLSVKKKINWIFFSVLSSCRSCVKNEKGLFFFCRSFPSLIKQKSLFMYYLKCLPRNTTAILVEREKDCYHLKERNGKSLRSFLFMTKKL